jgi:endonuclease III domain protein
VGQETADAMLLYIFGRKVFIADRYALRLFQRLGLSTAGDYTTLRAECMPLLDDVSLHTAQEWHAVIDEHGKAFRKKPQLDESWLYPHASPA